LTLLVQSPDGRSGFVHLDGAKNGNAP
jgi:hypothetical protein